MSPNSRLGILRGLERIPNWAKQEEVNFIRGIVIVAITSFVESEVSAVEPVPFPLNTSIPRYSGKPRIGVLDYWKSKFDSASNPKWYGWDEFVNFFRLRHCFAHKHGFLLSGHGQHIRDFLTKLENDGINDRQGNVIRPYYSITAKEKVLITDLNRLRILCMEFFVLTGVEGAITLNTGEVISF